MIGGSRRRVGQWPRPAVAIMGLVVIMSILVPGLAVAEPEKDLVGNPGTIAIDNGLINIDMFGEVDSSADVWLYPPGVSNCYWEAPLLGYAGNVPTWLYKGKVVTYYPKMGLPGEWYDAVITVNLDNGSAHEVMVRRAMTVLPGTKCFLVRYTFVNISGRNLPEFRFFQGVDYDVARSTGDEAGYSPRDFVWAHDLDAGNYTWVGFKGSRLSAHHAVEKSGEMWHQLRTGALKDAPYYRGDIGVGLEWGLGTLAAGSSAELLVRFAFANSLEELTDILDRLAVQIDIKAGGFPNPVNLGSMGVIPVAILTTSREAGESVDFDATEVDPSTVTFANARPAHSAIEDVDYDGDMDMIFHVRTQDAQLSCTDITARLYGKTVTGIEFFGRDPVSPICSK